MIESVDDYRYYVSFKILRLRYFICQDPWYNEYYISTLGNRFL
jgi:hypothetical protein